MIPVPYRVCDRAEETRDAATLRLEPVTTPVPAFAPGQFMMLYAHGVGEVAISVSGDPGERGILTHTVRAVGAVSRALRDARPGAWLGVRGPFGTGWDLRDLAGRDLVIVAGGLGLAPLRPAVLGLLAARDHPHRITVIVGARTPADFLFRRELDSWAADVELTVDTHAPGWTGTVGFVTEPLARLALDPARTTALLCGPEPMMRFCAQLLLTKGVPAHAIQVSLERDMKCGIGSCGHCQLGPLLVCRDGPVTTYDVAEPLLKVREL
ncbi:FAD/NAD(P)-binding protein [Amycolatopsis alkalitolerans]|uniref:Oxidoreductase n=1 Tax=Amycolatopsis alkalitolerans TaxID=2547244 RepID=A0A5C4LXM1_9PSEU|nr:FAD/NAD(P)-binding protein [Amycolatopsis alkalitolerans]TNC24174.1 oxidoreductase [Amycolatopsis alkalitolerans]